MCSRQLQSEGQLKGSAIVATVMGNIRLELALKPRHRLVRTAIGDKYVMEEVQARRARRAVRTHLLRLPDTGDSLCRRSACCGAVALSTLADLASDLKAYPQVLLNVRVRERGTEHGPCGRRGPRRSRRSPVE
jgi:phosphoglucosamine mutase